MGAMISGREGAYLVKGGIRALGLRLRWETWGGGSYFALLEDELRRWDGETAPAEDELVPGNGDRGVSDVVLVRDEDLRGPSGGRADSTSMLCKALVR